MKSFLIKLAVFLAIQGSIATAVFVMRPADPQRYLAATVDKHRAADRMPSPRILLVGGSGTAFSYDSPTMREVTGLPTLNLALHIGLGPFVMLNEARDLARPGDVVVVCFEYEIYQRGAANETLLMLLESCPERREYLAPRDVPVLLDNGLVFYGTILRNTMRRAAGRLIKPMPPYSRDGLNEFGDIVGHRNMPSPRKIPIPVLQSSERSLGIVIDALNQFGAEMAARGVKVFATYPAIPREYFDLNQKPVRRIQERLETRVKVPILGTPQDSVFEITDFFDTQYHMKGDAPVRRTRKVGEMLRLRLHLQQPQQ